jgi:hypothetical protein
VQYYAANGIYAKVRSEWLKLSHDTKAMLHEQLWQLLTLCCERMQLTTTRRICLAIATCIVLSRPPGNVMECIRRVQHILSSDISDQTCVAVLEVLRAIPDELESQQITGLPREKLLEEMDGCIGEILAVHSSLICTSTPLAQTSGLFSSLFASLDGWINVCSISTENLATSSPFLFEAALYRSVCEGTDDHVPRLAAACVESSLGFAAPATRNQRVSALCGIVKTLMGAFHSVMGNVRGGKYCSARSVIRILNAITNYDAAWLVGPGAVEVADAVIFSDFTVISGDWQATGENASVGVSPIGIGVLAGGAVLELLSSGPLSMLEDALDFFTPIQVSAGAVRDGVAYAMLTVFLAVCRHFPWLIGTLFIVRLRLSCSWA